METRAVKALSRTSLVGVPTRGRPNCLQRCLESHLEMGRRFCRATEYAVFDDSPDPETRRSIREMLRALRQDFGAEISYAGPQQKDQYVRELVRRGAPEAEARFALLNPGDFPDATGGNRNAILLHTVRQLLLQIDDDTLGRVMPPPLTSPGVACPRSTTRRSSGSPNTRPPRRRRRPSRPA
ncbi:MAG TPA: hypothetical protein VMS17_27790 [Gemmataceae bacterium]|nr:hypothetical protein [Gemmataceae bacterium]